MRALVFGASGGCGSHALTQLLDRGVECTAVVRSPAKLPSAILAHPHLTVVVRADATGVGEDDMAGLVQGCDTVVSCLGHNPSTLLGFWRETPRLCSDVTRAICHAAARLKPAVPIKLVVVSTAVVDHPDNTTDPSRGFVMRSILGLLERVIPPHADNVATARFLYNEVAEARNPHVEFCAVRPDMLTDDEASPHAAHAAHQGTSFFSPGLTSRANVGLFMADLLTVQGRWAQWRNSFPHVLNVRST